MTQQEVRSEFDRKVRDGMFQPVSRWITGPDAEDRLQDGICQTYEMFERYALEKDMVLDDGILVHSCRQRATDLGRRFVRDDAQPARDVMHPLNYVKGKVEVYRLDGLIDDEGDFVAQDEGEALVQGLPPRSRPARSATSSPPSTWRRGSRRYPNRTSSSLPCGRVGRRSRRRPRSSGSRSARSSPA